MDIVGGIEVDPAIDHGHQSENIPLAANPTQTGSIAITRDIEADREIDQSLPTGRIDQDHRGRGPTMPMDGVNHEGGVDLFHLGSEGLRTIFSLLHGDRGL